MVNVLLSLQGHTRSVYSVAFSPDGKILASGSGDQTVRLWEVSSGQCFTILQGHTDSSPLSGLQSRWKTLASGSSNEQTVRLWEVSSGQMLLLSYKVIPVRSIQWLSVLMEKSLPVGVMIRTVRLWEVSSGQCLDYSTRS